MIIKWHKNPIKTQIFLSPHEKEVFRLKVTLAEVKEAVHSAYFDLEWDRYDLETRIARAVSILKNVEDKQQCQDCYEEYLKELETGVHFGDCTCVATSCIKCMAEEILGVDTLAGMGKHTASQINGAFGAEGERTIDEAIQHLESHYPVRKGVWLNYSEEEFRAHVPRWKLQAEAAGKWLKRYRDEKYMPSLADNGGLRDISDLATLLQR